MLVKSGPKFFLENSKGYLVSESFFTLAQLSKRVPNHFPEHYPSKENRRRDLAPFFEI